MIRCCSSVVIWKKFRSTSYAEWIKTRSGGEHCCIITQLTQESQILKYSFTALRLQLNLRKSLNNIQCTERFKENICIKQMCSSAGSFLSPVSWVKICNQSVIWSPTCWLCTNRWERGQPYHRADRNLVLRFIHIWIRDYFTQGLNRREFSHCFILSAADLSVVHI